MGSELRLQPLIESSECSCLLWHSKACQIAQQGRYDYLIFLRHAVFCRCLQRTAVWKGFFFVGVNYVCCVWSAAAQNQVVQYMGPLFELMVWGADNEVLESKASILPLRFLCAREGRKLTVDEREGSNASTLSLSLSPTLSLSLTLALCLSHRHARVHTQSHTNAYHSHCDIFTVIMLKQIDILYADFFLDRDKQICMARVM